MQNNITKQFYTVVNAWMKNRSFVLAIILGKQKRRGF